MPQLTEEQKVKLDSNIKNMLANGATNEQVVAYANDFKNKFSTVLKPTGETADGIPTVTIQEKVNVTEPQKVKQPSNPIIKSALKMRVFMIHLLMILGLYMLNKKQLKIILIIKLVVKI